jgi:hypothetical protein
MSRQSTNLPPLSLFCPNAALGHHAQCASPFSTSLVASRQRASGEARLCTQEQDKQLGLPTREKCDKHRFLFPSQQLCSPFVFVEVCAL